MRNKKALLVLAVGILSLSVLSSSRARESGPRYGGTLKIGVAYPQFERLDGRYMAIQGLAPAPYLVYDSLFEPGPKGNAHPVPSLASGIETKDNKIWTLHLRKGVKFHNGREMTAKDVKVNLEWRIGPPKGWRPFTDSSLLKGLKTVEVVDKHTARIVLEAPFAPLQEMLNYAVRAIVPPEEAEKWDKEFYMHACGTGPYKVVEVKPNERVVMERFDGYWGPKPYIDRIVWKEIRSDDARFIALQKGEVDMVQMLDDASVPVAKKDPRLEVQISASPFILHKYFFNVRRWPMSDIRFRQALWMGVDWKNVVLASSPIKATLQAISPLHRTPWESAENMKLVPRYDPEEAKRLIKAVERDGGKRIPPLYWLDSTAALNRNISEMAALSLKQIGVPVNLKLMSHALWYEKLLRDPKLEWDLGGFGSGWQASPWFGFTHFQTNSGIGPDGNSLGGYSNPELDRLVKIMETSTDEKLRSHAIQAAEKILIREAACIPVLHNHGARAWYKKLKGIVFTDSGKVNVTTAWGANMWIDE